MEGKKLHILFVSLVIIKDLTKRGIYPDLIKYFISRGHHVTIMSPVERREKNGSQVVHGDGFTNIRYKTLNNTKTKYVEKLASTLVIDTLLKSAIKKHVKTPLDIVVCATPPITMSKSITYIKNTFNIPCYLLIKDIFPANIADLGILSKKSIIYSLFRKQEKKLYQLADFIGCMSPANVEYIKSQNPELDPNIIEVNPNTIWPLDFHKDENLKSDLRIKYNITDGARVFFYGGNLGKPQMISFVIELMSHHRDNKKIHFFIIGDGTDYKKIESWKNKNCPDNLTLMPYVPKAEYDKIVHIADVGMVFLDNRFKIPNFPNRILSYMENYLPVFLATDKNTDISTMALEGGFGLWAESGDIKNANNAIYSFLDMSNAQLSEMGQKGHQYLYDHFLVQRSYDLIVNKIS